jgi:transcriptional regulator with GAF, ATPase, and Fis domain
MQTSLVDAVEAYEKDLILDALKTARGNCAKAARLLRSTERIIGYKVRKYSIDPRRFRDRSLSAVPRPKFALARADSRVQ